MDLLDVIQRGRADLPDGNYQPGLKAVINHIEVAMRHLERGQSTGDPALFTDAVYRCNQAYEGSIKELYRVIAGKDASKLKTSVIEAHLEKAGVLRPKIITQLNRYRQEWRNPSTHDYTMDFDENEAFLAIVNIAAFAKMAISQIGSSIAYVEAATRSDETEPAAKKRSLALALTTGIAAAALLSDPPETLISKETVVPEGQVASSLAGYLSRIRNISTRVEHLISDAPRYYADLHVEREQERCVVEFKRDAGGMFAVERTFDNLQRYMEVGGYTEGVAVVFSGKSETYGIATVNGSPDGLVQVLVGPDRILRNQRYGALKGKITLLDI